MDKLTIEEKAKRYDEAIERAKKWYNAPNIDKIPTYGNRVIEEIFPEFKESDGEDEKIRKTLINVFATHKDYEVFFGVSVKDIRAWLEKQGNPTDINPSEFDLRLNRLLKQFETLPKEELASSLSFYLNVVQNDGTYREEKQGEQKPQGKSALEAIKEEKVDNANKVEPKDYYSIDPHFGKPVDKVEPKFHEGEWIIDKSGLVQQVLDFRGGIYTCTYNSFTTDCESNYRLWTIDDAKDGDVLAEDSCIFIIEKLNSNGTAIVHCCLFDDGEFNLTSSNIEFDVDSTHPTTKEQRDTLFTKMKEAGYEWDTEKKELKEIKNEIEIPFGAKDSELQEATYFIPQGFHAEIDDDKVVIKKGEKPATWSEEDEVGLGDAMWAIEQAKNIAKNENDMGNLWYAETWLKSLKERIRG